jgi:hypothetical protein
MFTFIITAERQRQKNMQRIPRNRTGNLSVRDLVVGLCGSVYPTVSSRPTDFADTVEYGYQIAITYELCSLRVDCCFLVNLKILSQLYSLHSV